MKLQCLFTTIGLLTFFFASAQNTFPANGKVGVGTSTPNYNLQVQKTGIQPALMIGGGYAGSPRLQLYGLDADIQAYMGLGSDMAGGPYEHSIYFPTGLQNAPGKLTIGDYNGNQYNTRFTILQNGNVGIGTSSPNAKLNVNGVITAGDFASVSSLRGALNNYTNLLLGGAIRDNGNGSYTVTGDGGSNYFSAIRMDNQGGNVGSISFYNGATVGGNNYTLSNAALAGYQRMTIVGDKVGIGTANPDALLTVNGTVHAKEIKIDLSIPVPDYVFEKSYKLKSLKEVELYIKENKHLPEVSSATVMQKEGVNIAELNMKLLQKVEELTLYVIEQNKEIQKLKIIQRKDHRRKKIL
jgi:hypothetical protein